MISQRIYIYQTKKTILLLLICFLCVLMLFGCQPTPDEDYITQKDTIAMLEAAKSIPSSTPLKTEQTDNELTIRARYMIPETYQYDSELAEGHFTLHINAKVDVPSVSAVPIVRIQKGRFDPEMIRTIFNILCNGTDMYYMQENGVYTKEQIADRLQYLMNEIANEESYIIEHGQKSLDDTKIEIQELQTLYAKAPDSIEQNMCLGDLVIVEYRGLSIPGIYAISRDRNASFTAINPESHQTFISPYIIYTSSKQLPDIQDCFPVDNYSSGEIYTPVQAEADIISFFKQAGIADIAIDSILAPKNQTEETLDPLYLVQCVRKVVSVNTAYSRESVRAFSTGEQYSPTWKYEHIDIWVDKSGILAFNWTAPINVDDIIVDDANLLPFEKIMEIYLKMVNTKYAAAMNITNPDLQNGATTQSEYNIDRICLTLQRIQEPDEWDSALLVPVWNFYGTNTRIEVEDYQEYTITNYTQESMLSINAIDGSIIDIHKGY